MASSFNQVKAIEQAFLGEVAPGGGTSLQTLASLRTMQQQLGAGAASAQNAGMLIKARLGEHILQKRLDDVITDGKMESLKLKRTEANFPKTSLIG